MLVYCLPKRLCTTFLPPRPNRYFARTMATIVHDSVPHEDRTAAQPRQNRIEPVTITHIRDINSSTRVLRLSPQDPNHTINVRTSTPTPPQTQTNTTPSSSPANGSTPSSPPSPKPAASPSPRLPPPRAPLPTDQAISSSPCKNPPTRPRSTSTSPPPNSSTRP